MLHYAVVFLVIALIAALFGFGGIAAGVLRIDVSHTTRDQYESKVVIHGVPVIRNYDGVIRSANERKTNEQ